MEVDKEEDMEVVHDESTPDHSSFKRFGLKNSLQTNFGEDYVFQIASKDDCTPMAVSLSINEIKLYSPLTGQYLGQCKGHSSTIDQISFLGPSANHVLYSTSIVLSELGIPGLVSRCLV